MEFNRSLKVIIFDFDGTLFDLEIDWESLRKQLGVLGTDKSLGALVQEYRLQEHPDLMHVTNIELAAVAGKRLSQETLDVLGGLSKSYNLAVLTRNSRLAVEEVAKSMDIKEKLYIVGREDTKKLKPDPEGVVDILAHFQCQPHQAVLVGDTYHDIEAARAAGARSIIVSNSNLAFRPEGADLYIASLTNLPTAVMAL